MNEYEKKLFDNGFTTKDIGRLRSIVKKDKSQSDTLQTLVIDLSKRFWGGVIGVSILILIGLYGALNADKSDFLSYMIVPGFAFLVIYFFTPLRLSWKAYKFIKKNDNS